MQHPELLRHSKKQTVDFILKNGLRSLIKTMVLLKTIQLS